MTASILVIGDVMLDRYWFGDASRLSPEAPVPVVKVTTVEERLGGAANVARNCASLGAQVRLMSVVGPDEPGRRIAELAEAERINADLLVDSGISTIVKLRLVARHQQMVRIDFETEPSHEVLRRLMARIPAAIAESDVVILSDYGKGGLTHISEIIRGAKEAGKPVLVDPKGSDYSRYAGASIITPNRAELRDAAGAWNGERELEVKAQKLRQEMNLEALLVTRSEEGMTLFSDAGAAHEPTKAREVFDVSGAGDTVIAALAVERAAGRGWREAVHVANVAAGIVVGKLGTATVSRAELAEALSEKA
jgi:D-glycero-beta-D-manno-heptose-7-phosphate kinase